MRLGGVEPALGLVYRRLGDYLPLAEHELALVVVAGRIELGLGLLELRLKHGDLLGTLARAEIVELRLGFGEPRFRGGDRLLLVGVVEAEEERAIGDRGAAVDRQLDDAAGGIRRDIDIGPLDIALDRVGAAAEAAGEEKRREKRERGGGLHGEGPAPRIASRFAVTTFLISARSPGADRLPSHATEHHRLGDAEDEDLPDQREGAEPRLLVLGYAEGDGDEARADHGGAAHEAEDHLEGSGGLHLLAHDKARPALGLGAAEHDVDIGHQEMLEHLARGLRRCRRFRLRGERQRRSDRAGDAAGDMLGDGDEQRFLAAEVIGDGRKVGAGRLGDLAGAGALEAEAAEDIERCLDQLRAGLRAAVALRAPVGARGRGAGRLGGAFALGSTGVGDFGRAFTPVGAKGA